MFNVSMDELMRVLRDFHNLTNFLITVFDAERNNIAAYPNHMCDFCNEVRKSPTLQKKCIASDLDGFDLCDKSGKPCIYQCHMSVTEAISPIKFNDIAVGYLMFGQIRTKDIDGIREMANKANTSCNISISDAMIDSMTVASDETIVSALNMMTMCAEYLYSNEIIKNHIGIIEEKLRKYVSNNLASDLSTESVCAKFYISRSKLYRISVNIFGIGFSDYVRDQRINEAKKLLKKTELSIAEITERVGISDPNYFIRIFKRHVGTTPLQYRKRS